LHKRYAEYESDFVVKTNSKIPGNLGRTQEQQVSEEIIIRPLSLYF
jgi:hypothetical protein